MTDLLVPPPPTSPRLDLHGVAARNVRVVVASKEAEHQRPLTDEEILRFAAVYEMTAFLLRRYVVERVGQVPAGAPGETGAAGTPVCTKCGGDGHRWGFRCPRHPRYRGEGAPPQLQAEPTAAARPAQVRKARAVRVAPAKPEGSVPAAAPSVEVSTDPILPHLAATAGAPAPTPTVTSMPDARRLFGEGSLVAAAFEEHPDIRETLAHPGVVIVAPPTFTDWNPPPFTTDLVAVLRATGNQRMVTFAKRVEEATAAARPETEEAARALARKVAAQSKITSVGLVAHLRERLYPATEGGAPGPVSVPLKKARGAKGSVSVPVAAVGANSGDANTKFFQSIVDPQTKLPAAKLPPKPPLRRDLVVD